MTIAITGAVSHTTSINVTKDGQEAVAESLRVTFNDTPADGFWTKVYTADVTVNTAASLDLTSLSNIVIGSQNFGTLKTLHVLNTGSVALTVGGGTNAIVPQIVLAAGASLALDKVAITCDSTHKLIALSASSSCTCKVIIAGT